MNPASTKILTTSIASTTQPQIPKIPAATADSETNPRSAIRNPQFPLADLPQVLRDFTTLLATTAEVSPEFAATTCLGVLSASLGAGAVSFDGHRRIRPNLFLLTVAPKSLDTTTCHRLAYAPLHEAQRHLDQAHAPLSEAETFAHRAQLKTEWHRIVADRDLSRQQRDDLLFQNNLAQKQLDTPPDPAAIPNLLLTAIPRGKLHPHLLTRPQGESLALVNPDATAAAQILSRRIPTHLADEQTLLAAHAGQDITLADRTHHLRTVPDPCVTLHWTLPPEAWDEILTTKATASSPLLPHFLYLKSEACPRPLQQILATPPPEDLALLTQESDPSPSGEAAAAGSLGVPPMNSPSGEAAAASSLGVPPMNSPHSGEAAAAGGLGVPPMNSPNGKAAKENEALPIPSTATPLPPNTPTPPLDPTPTWHTTIANLLTHRTAKTPVEYTLSPEAHLTLKAYESRIREQIRNCPNPTQSRFITQNPETAYRLTLLLHATEQASLLSPSIPFNPENLVSPVLKNTLPAPTEAPQIRNPQSEIRNATALAAIALTEFFSDQHRQLTSDLITLPENALLDRVIRLLEKTSNGYMLLGQLYDRHRITTAQATRLAETFPKLLQLKPTDPDSPGRPSYILTLDTNYPHNPCRNSAYNMNISEHLQRHHRPPADPESTPPPPIDPTPAEDPTPTEAPTAPTAPHNISEPPKSPANIGPISPLGPIPPSIPHKIPPLATPANISESRVAWASCP